MGKTYRFKSERREKTRDNERAQHPKSNIKSIFIMEEQTDKRNRRRIRDMKENGERE